MFNIYTTKNDKSVASIGGLQNLSYEETGQSFVSYLTDYRMERALFLLMEQQEKTYVIANMVGYSDPNYFSYVFKKKYGLSPSKYKQNMTKA